MPVALFASDYDGTLCRGRMIDRCTLDMVRRFRNCGGVFGICSGRDPGTLKQELAQQKLEYDFLILMNGARIEVDSRCIQEHFLDGWQQVLSLLRQKCLFFTVIGRNTVYHFRNSLRMPVEFPAGEQAYIDALQQVYAVQNRAEDLDTAYQISCRTENEENAVALAEEIGAYGLTAWPNCEYVDIVPSNISKAQAVGVAAAYLQVPACYVYTAGDGRNDILMLEQYHGFAMVQAEQCVRQAAAHTVSSVGEALKQVSREAFW